MSPQLHVIGASGDYCNCLVQIHEWMRDHAFGWDQRLVFPFDYIHAYEGHIVQRITVS